MKSSRIQALFSLMMILLTFACSAAADHSLDAETIVPGERKILTLGASEETRLLISAEEGQAFYRADFKNEEIDAKLTMELLSSDGLSLAKESAYSKKESYLGFKAEPGKTYYLKFTHAYGSPEGRFTVSLQRNPDAHGDDPGHAAEIGLDQTMILSFDGTGDRDCLCLTAQEGSAFYRVEYKNESVDTSLYMEVLDQNGFVLLKDNAYQGKNRFVDFKARPGERYYLRFYRNNEYIGGEYTARVIRTPDAEPDTPETAEEQPLSREILASFNGDGDVDCFRFTAESGSAFYRAVIKNDMENSSMEVELLDQNGFRMEKEYVYSRKEGSISWKAESGAVYYFRAGTSGSERQGMYSLTVDRYPDNEPDTPEEAAVLADGVLLECSAGNRDDQDWFVLEAGSEPVYAQVALCVPSGGEWTRAQAYNGAQEKTKNLSAGPDSRKTMTLPIPANGKVYLRVTADNTGIYTVERKDAVDLGGTSVRDACSLTAGGTYSSALEIDDDVDYFILPASDAAVMIVNMDASYLRARLIDEAGQEISQSVSVYPGKKQVFSADRSPVYLRVEGGSGRYSVAACTPQEHVRSEKWETVQTALCGREGLEQMPCSVCAQPAQTRAVAALEHRISGLAITQTAPGCETEGVEVRLCELCGVVLEETAIPAAGHTAGEWRIFRRASCDDAGLEIRSCTACGAVLQERAIPASGHLNTGWQTVAEPACAQEGLQYRVCLDCGKRLEQERIPAYGHLVGEAGIRMEPTCTEDGFIRKTCRLCQTVMEETVVSAAGHTYTEWMRIKEPTMSEEGAESRRCSACGHTETRILEKKGLFDGVFGK